MKLIELTRFLEELAPTYLQEGYDNSGLIVGDEQKDLTKALVCLDVTEEVIDEAIGKGANLVIAHHPIVFRGLKRITGKSYVERIIIKSIQHDIAIYAIHTNLDNALSGVNAKIGEKLGVMNFQILAPKGETLFKLITFVPLSAQKQVLEALFDAGAGRIGNYHEASFRNEGLGTFKANDLANPTIGSKGVQEEVQEFKLEVLVEKHLANKVLRALRKAHPYEEVAYDLIPLANLNQERGSGMVGDLAEPMKTIDFFKQLQSIFGVPVVRHTPICKHEIQRVAWCGGAGSFLLPHAKAAGADVFITGDFKYHEFFDAENQLIIADIGHYESEQFTSELLIDKLNKKFRNFAFLLTEINTNPVNYFI